ncbi:MAG: hypothetical protein NTY24_02185, partial [Mycobacterium sp.]|nr:hypothetical protein [Mycobacterium sp.]
MIDLRRPGPAGILAGALADVLFADPRRGHPVAGFGRCAQALETITYRDSRAAGTVHGPLGRDRPGPSARTGVPLTGAVGVD